MRKNTIRALNGWNSRCLHIITDRGYREEAVDPSFNLVANVRAKRLRWLGHVLREGESHLVRRVLLGYNVIEDKAQQIS